MRFARAVAVIPVVAGFSLLAPVHPVAGESQPAGTVSAPQTNQTKADAAKAHRRRKHALWPRARQHFVLESTAYGPASGFGRCATTSSGEGTHEGVVAVSSSWGTNRWFQIRSGPLRGRVMHGVDHYGSGTQFDIWMPRGENHYGRHRIRVAQISRKAAKRALSARDQHYYHNCRKRQP